MGALMGNKIWYILGLQSYANENSGAALLRCSEDGEVLDFVAISEERLIRQKHPYVFPIHSLKYCLDHYGISSLSDIDLIVTDHVRQKRWFFSGPSYNISEFDYLKLKLDFDPDKIIVISHHMAHAASVYYTSDFNDAAILIVDGNGSDLETTSFLVGEGDRIRYIDSYRAQGIGALYHTVSHWILNMGPGGEGKTMGLAPFGAAYDPVLRIEGRYDGIKTDYSRFVRRQPYSDVLNQINPAFRINPLRGEHRRCPDKTHLLDPYFARVAFDVQQEAERAMVHLGREIEKRTGKKNICLSGGVALNSVANKIMFDATGFERIGLFPAASDSGIPLGLALWGYHNARELGDAPRRRVSFKHAYTGTDYGKERILDMLRRHDIPHRRVGMQEVARRIADGEIIGWFQGGSEYGPRALGHRSILADSRRAEMTDVVNSRVKHREGFRPFAPAVLAEHCAEYFDIEGESPFMLLVADVKKPREIPAVTHVDNTARVQTVTHEANGVFYELVAAFKDITGVPVILNTSFNDAGEPIVETPEDATICFLRTEMHALVLDDWLIDVRDIADKGALAARLDEERQAAIAARRQEALDRFFPGYNAEECRTLVEEYNRMSAWHACYSPKYELEKQVSAWLRDKARVLIVGTVDHTALLPQVINGFTQLDVVGYVDFDGRPDLHDGRSQPYPVCGWDAVEAGNYDALLVSSHEFMYDILDAVQAKKVGKPVYAIYDNATRSMLNTLDRLPHFPQPARLMTQAC